MNTQQKIIFQQDTLLGISCKTCIFCFKEGDFYFCLKYIDHYIMNVYEGTKYPVYKMCSDVNRNIDCKDYQKCES